MASSNLDSRCMKVDCPRELCNCVSRAAVRHRLRRVGISSDRIKLDAARKGQYAACAFQTHPGQSYRAAKTTLTTIYPRASGTYGRCASGRQRLATSTKGNLILATLRVCQDPLLYSSHSALARLRLSRPMLSHTPFIALRCGRHTAC
jgi:hypothetical protein